MSTAKPNPLRVVADTNIIVSAVVFGGLPDRVLTYCLLQKEILYVSEFLLQEVTGVLEHKFAWSRQRATKTVALIQQQSKLITPTDRLTLVSDEADNRILECASASRANYLVTGDQGILRLKTLNGTAIVTAAQFLKKELP